MSIRTMLVVAAFALASLGAAQSVTFPTLNLVDTLEISPNGDSVFVRKVKSVSN
jgi:hypothetical protein